MKPESRLLSENGDLASAVRLVEYGHSLALVKDGKILAVEDGNGVRPLLAASARLGGELCGASLADRVVGVAVARLAAYFCIAAVYGKTGSESAAEELDRAGIPHEFEETVPYILNRDKNGRCPIETLALSKSTPEETYKALVEFFSDKKP